MPAAIQLPTEIVVGSELVVAGTGFANTTAYTIDIGLPGPNQPSLKLKGTTSGAGAVTATAVATVIPGNEGIANITVSDGTSTVKGTVKISRSV